MEEEPPCRGHIHRFNRLSNGHIEDVYLKENDQYLKCRIQPCPYRRSITLQTTEKRLRYLPIEDKQLLDYWPHEPRTQDKYCTESAHRHWDNDVDVGAVDKFWNGNYYDKCWDQPCPNRQNGILLPKDARLDGQQPSDEQLPGFHVEYPDQWEGYFTHPKNRTPVGSPNPPNKDIPPHISTTKSPEDLQIRTMSTTTVAPVKTEVKSEPQESASQATRGKGKGVRIEPPSDDEETQQGGEGPPGDGDSDGDPPDGPNKPSWTPSFSRKPGGGSGGGGGPGGGGGGGPSGGPSHGSNATGTRGGKPKIKDVTPFDGTRSKSKKFMRELFILFTARQEDYQKEEQMIATALSYMDSGSALTWSELFVERQLKRSPFALASSAFGTWENFVKEFKESFGEVDQETQKAIQLEKLAYDQTKTIDEFNVEFSMLIDQSGISGDVAQVNYYRIKLPAPLRQKIMDKGVPNTLKAWMKEAVRLDNSYRANNAITALLRKPQTKKPEQRSRTGNARAITFERLDPKERSELMKKGQCFICKKQGHMARTCPNRKEQKVRVTTMEEEESDEEEQDDDKELRRLEKDYDPEDF